MLFHCKKFAYAMGVTGLTTMNCCEQCHDPDEIDISIYRIKFNGVLYDVCCGMKDAVYRLKLIDENDGMSKHGIKIYPL